ncbi:MAG: methylmalonyl Co-A mutase-associated GTPase MeaB [Flavobacteriales bacterium]|nr:methylmalonyl Co-A mutase-associated GTPase MeaB [Flavobacteriales bacterium]|tara:strand:- start:5405 stop:6346 length:942 start_codon:yes stop_codon:yes gene_type:complete
MSLAKDIIKGNRVALGKGITLLESTLNKDQEKAQDLILECLPYSGNSIRIGITGVPGVGKSTFIETFGKLLINEGKQVAVLAIDPTSQKSHGSILGDKSRMHQLSANKNAFIRPSPSGGILGGVTHKTRESIILCEAAGFDIILIETVGVGQSETTVSHLVDFFLLLMLAGAGDELQGIKRGIMELADTLIINKSDGDNLQKAKNAALEYKRALHLFQPMENGWIPKVNTCSALENTGIKEIYKTINTFDKQMTASGWKIQNREKQNTYWLHQRVKEELGTKKYKNLLSNGQVKILEKELKKGRTIYQLLNSF